MGKRSFTWNPDGTCIVGSFNDPKHKCLLDYWSMYHFYFTGFVYLVLHHYLNITTLKSAIILCLIVTLLHIVEEYFGNTSRISTEGVVIDYIGPMFDPEINPELRPIDNDYLENSIGDILSGIVSCVLIIMYWYYFGKLPYFYLFGFFIVSWMLLRLASMLYGK